MDIKSLLKKYFGYEDFRAYQEQIINALLNKNDVLAVLPTGGGKSLCYQLPAVYSDGITIVISPLISLMKDQVDSLNEQDISASFINSSMNNDEFNNTMNLIKNRNIKLLYVAPERLENQYFIEFIKNIPISFIAVDEAHCVSHWGHDFRPSYKNIIDFINSFANRPPVIALTATATKNVRCDIINLIGLKNPQVFVASFDRPNIRLKIEEPKNKLQYLLENINKEESTIIYASTRKNVESVYEFLNENNIKTEKYHAGMSPKDRNTAQNNFINDETNIIVATNAFGMGIDKSNVRKVFHYNMPTDLESYYQEAGRAGRDGLESEAILLFSKQDIVTAKNLLRNNHNPYANSKLNAMIGYTNTTKCMRRYLLSYFQENLEHDCNNCSSCLEGFETVEVTKEAQMILSCVYHMKGKFGSVMVSDVLKGSENQKIKQFNLDCLSTYGLMRNYPKNEILDIISSLMADGYLVTGQYGTINLTKDSINILKSNIKYEIKYRKTNKSNKTKSKTTNNLNDIQKELFEILRNKRMELSRQHNIAPYIIFSDATLKDMVAKLPLDEISLTKVYGVGESKAKKYGEIFIEQINNFVLNNPDIKNAVIKDDLSKDIPRKKGESLMQTLELYKSGKNISEIAQIKNISSNTVMNHFYQLALENLLENFQSYVSNEKKVQIDEAIKKVGMEKLKPIKDMLSDDISYDDIRLYIIEKMSN